MTALRVDGLVNARDLGGLPLRGGGRTPTGVFHRAENVDALTPAGWAQLRALGVRTVVDLRRDGERAADTGSRPDWLRTVPVDHDGERHTGFWARWEPGGLFGTALYYPAHLAELPERSVAALTAILSAAPGGVLFHCVSGRDRTGLISMLLLAAVDVEPDAIVADYLETVRLGDVRAAHTGRPNDEQARDALCRAHGSSTEDAFRTALRGLDLPGVLTGGGMRPDVRHALRTWRGHLPATPSRPT